LSDFQYKEEVKTYKKTGKSITFINSQTYEVIQGTLLYNKIECYNKEVQRSPFCSAKGAFTPQNIKDTQSSSS